MGRILLLVGLVMSAAFTDVTSPLVATQDPSAYNGWTEFDRATPLRSDLGAITHIGMYTTVPCQWRPKIGRRLDPHDKGAPKWIVIYNHSQMVSHAGNGWQWIGLATPQSTWDGEMFAGAFISGCPGATMQMSKVRAEINSDASGVVTLAENAFETFAMGARYFGSPASGKTYYYDFTRGDLDGWQANAASVVESNGNFVATSPFVDDHNQDAIMGGPLSLIAYRYFEMPLASGGYAWPDFNGARLRLRIKFDGWSAPAGTHYYLWFQGRNPGTSPSTFADWPLTGMPLDSYVDGNWHDLDVTLPSDPAQWTFAGGPAPTDSPPGIYGFASLSTALANLQDFIVVACRPSGTSAPTGTFRMQYFQADYH